MAVLLLAAFAANGPILVNQFAQDDLSVIVENPAVHTLTNLPNFFSEPYWPKPYPPANYRPLATTAFAAQWSLGAGAPWIFRLTSLLLLLGAGVGVFRLASLLGPRPVAIAVAALFVVHPVHVEAVALGVNQGEIVVTWLAAMLVNRLVAGRDGALGAPAIVGMTALYAAALWFKETGLVLIALALAAIVLFPATREAKRPGRLVLLVVMAAVAALAAAARTAVLGGDVLGTPVAEALRGLSLSERALTMLGVVPHWARLLLWPAHLSADYAPSEILPAVTWGAGQTLGLLIALAWLGLVGATWRRRPVVALGLVWVAIGLFPVSNLLAPTGVVLAERTLFLPSAGLAIALAGGVDWLIERIPSVKRPLALAATIVGILGVARSASRSQVWRNEDILWGQTVLDAPKSQRAHHAFAQLRFRDGARAEADGHFRLAVEYAINDWRPAADYADRLRDAGLCGPAADYYQRALVFEPRHDGVRNKRILCLIKEGQFAEAATEARAAEQRSTRPEIAAVFRRLAVVADSGQAATER